MPAPIIFISRYRILEGRADQLNAAFSAGINLIASTKPRTALFGAYVDPARMEVRFVHAFPDAEAIRQHFAGAAERASAVADMISLLGFELYGAAPAELANELRTSAGASGAEVVWLEQDLGGFLRPPR